MPLGARGMLAGLLLWGGITPAVHAVDFNNDGLGDIWGVVYNATGLAAAADADGDGVPNSAESTAGTDPFNPTSFHAVTSGTATGGAPRLGWQTRRGKQYDLMIRTNLTDGAWAAHLTWYGADTGLVVNAPPAEHGAYQGIAVRDVDTDRDGVADWEEFAIGLNPATNRSHRTSMTDSNKVRNAMRGTNLVSVAAIDADVNEGWPDAGVFAIRRTGRVDRITVPFTVGGSAAPGSDYTLSTEGSVTFEPGVREVWVEVHPVADALAEGAETVTLALGTSTQYRLAAPVAATVTLSEAVAGLPSAKEASRFLAQATFGVTTQELEQVRLSGLGAWMTNQFSLPPTYLSNYMDVVSNVYTDTYGQHKLLAWWERSLHAPDQLRHRMAFALSQILVVSDTSDTLNNEWACMIAYYDTLLHHALGNYRDLLRAVTRHPAMGIYLSHFGNQKADPETGRYPDENYAREVMQLFSIGLWELNPDGTRRLDDQGLPIPTYDNGDITELARVFTGMSWGSGNTNLWWEFYWPDVYDLRMPMRMWDVFHDTNSKTLVRGAVLPAGQPGMKDVDDAVDNLYLHPNVGPFLGRRLIQRFTTSNPSTGYLARVSAAFDDNGQGVRGDLKAVLAAVLLDPEARDPSSLTNIVFGKQREPYLRLVNLGRTFDAAASNTFYEMWWLDEVYAMQPFSSPSVFNFYSPDYRPSGPVKDAGLVAPEFQITTAVTGISAPNHFLTAVESGLNRWPGDPDSTVRLDATSLLPLAASPDALLARLDLLLTYGRLRPAQHQIIQEALQRIPDTDPAARVRMALYLITTSPEFCVLK